MNTDDLQSAVIGIGILTFIIVSIINAINFIDGIDGLAVFIVVSFILLFEFYYTLFEVIII